MGKKAKAMEERYIEMRRKFWGARNTAIRTSSELVAANKKINELQLTITKLSHPSNGNVTNITDAPSLRPRTYVASKTVKNPKERRVQLTVTGTNGGTMLWVTFTAWNQLREITALRVLNRNLSGQPYIEFLPVTTADVSGHVRQVNEILGRPVVYAEVL